MTENNWRVLKPWRAYIPSLSQLQHRAKVQQLNSYIKHLLHQRWAARHRSGSCAANSQDVLERIMQALEVNDSLRLLIYMCDRVAISSSKMSKLSSAYRCTCVPKTPSCHHARRFRKLLTWLFDMGSSPSCFVGAAARDPVHSIPTDLFKVVCLWRQ